MYDHDDNYDKYTKFTKHPKQSFWQMIQKSYMYYDNQTASAASRQLWEKNIHPERQISLTYGKLRITWDIKEGIHL